MATEEEVRNLILPKMREVAEICKTLGVPVICFSQVSPGRSAIVRSGDQEISKNQFLVFCATKSVGDMEFLQAYMCGADERNHEKWYPKKRRVDSQDIDKGGNDESV